jgi:hypothetical protein
MSKPEEQTGRIRAQLQETHTKLGLLIGEVRWDVCASFDIILFDHDALEFTFYVSCFSSWVLWKGTSFMLLPPRHPQPLHLHLHLHWLHYRCQLQRVMSSPLCYHYRPQ